MQKTLLLAFCCLLLATGTFAQRHCDLAAKITSPKPNDTIGIGEQFLIQAMLYNLGPDTLRMTDTAKFALAFDGGAISFGNDTANMKPYIELTGHAMAPGDSSLYGFTFMLFDGWQTGKTTFCVSFNPLNAQQIVDADTTNNTNCIQMTVLDPNTGISNTVLQTVATYPNPARDEVNFRINAKVKADAAIRIFDQAGRTLISETRTLNPGEQNIRLNTSQLSPGIYFYKLTAGSSSYNGKLQIQ